MEIIGNGHLAKIVTESLQKVGIEGDFSIIAIDTPINDDFSVDLRSIYEAIIKINGTVIIMSPVPIGTCRKIQNLLGKELVYNPENLQIAKGVELYLNADRQIIGCDSIKMQEQMKEFYSWFKNPILFMSLESAEMVKHATNSFLATSIIFANQIEKYCKKVTADYTDVLKGLKTDSRIGNKAYLTPGEPSKHLKRDLKILGL